MIQCPGSYLRIPALINPLNYTLMYENAVFKYRVTGENAVNILADDFFSIFREHSQYKRNEEEMEFVRRVFGFSCVKRRRFAMGMNAAKFKSKRSVEGRFHLAMSPFSLNTFLNNVNISASGLWKFADSFIMSKPIPVLTKSFAFLNIDLITIICLLLSVVVTSILLTQTQSLGYSRRKSRVSTFFRTLWDVASLILLEPYPAVYRTMSSRFLLMSWLTGLTFFLLEMGCHLQSDFCETNYIYLDTIDDLVRYNVTPNFVANEHLLDHLEDRTPDNERDKNILKWLENVPRRQKVGTYWGLVNRKYLYPRWTAERPNALIANGLKVYNALSITEASIKNKSDLADIIDFTFYSSKIRSEYLYFGIPNSIAKEDKIFSEYITLAFQILFETEALTNIDLKYKRVEEKFKWIKPLKVIKPLNSLALESPFKMFICGMFLSIGLFILEIIMKLSQMLGKRFGLTRRIHVQVEST